MNILVTGVAGYIGSHTCVVLLDAGYDVIIADNLYNSKLDVLDKIDTITGKKPKFYNIDVSKKEELDILFKENDIEAILHFAGYKAVGESVGLPLKYYRNNLLGTIALTECALEYNVSKFIFSSSATVYGDGLSPFI